MNLFILNEKFESVYVLNDFESFIWTDRYNEAGEFEVYAYPSPGLIEYGEFGSYLWFSETNRLMIIEYFERTSNAETGDRVAIKGRSLEWILTRRIVWTDTIIDDTLQNGIKSLINSAIINPTIADRKISNFIFKDTDDPAILNMTFNDQFLGNSLYDVIKEACKRHGVGFRILLDKSFNFVFELYYGKDRSYSQIALPQVTFSRRLYSNINSSEYIENWEDYKNVVLVSGNEGSDVQTFISVGTESGLNRRETFINASGVSGKEVTHAQFIAALEEEGNQALSDNKIAKAFDGSVDANRPFIYGEDYFLGDLVEVEDDFGVQGKFRISEFMWNYSNNNVSCYPTFESLFEKENE